MPSGDTSGPRCQTVAARPVPGPASANFAHETMPVHTCQYFYECEACKTLLKPSAGQLLRLLLLRIGECPLAQAQRLCCGLVKPRRLSRRQHPSGRNRQQRLANGAHQKGAARRAPNFHRDLQLHAGPAAPPIANVHGVRRVEPGWRVFAGDPEPV